MEVDLTKVVEFQGDGPPNKGEVLQRKLTYIRVNVWMFQVFVFKLIPMFYSAGPKNGLWKCMYYFVNSHLILDESILMSFP